MGLIQTLGLFLDKRADVPAAPASRGLGDVDLCFVVDTTGSMSAFISAAKATLLDTMTAVSTEAGVTLRVGLVEYRDHPPQETSFVTRTVPLTEQLGAIRRAVDRMEASGGGDAPEAVYDGVHVACTTMPWRPYSLRLILLVGDAPPQGFSEVRNRRDPFAVPTCTCGLTRDRTTVAAERHNVVVNALSIGASADATAAFGELARATGGRCDAGRDGSNVIAAMTTMLRDEFRDLEFDAYVLDAIRTRHTIDAGETASVLGVNRLKTAESIARLGRRGLLAV